MWNVRDVKSPAVRRGSAWECIAIFELVRDVGPYLAPIKMKC